MLTKPTQYRIKVQGVVPVYWFKQWAGLELTVVSSHTELIGILPDQTALHGLLNQIRDLGLPLLLVEQLEIESHKEVKL